jgi:hypothetical protein
VAQPALRREPGDDATGERPAAWVTRAVKAVMKASGQTLHQPQHAAFRAAATDVRSYPRQNGLKPCSHSGWVQQIPER